MNSLLDALWEGRLEVLATNLATGGREHLEIASLTRHIESDYGGRFLVELLQNGSDQARRALLTASTIHIVRTSNLIAVTNGGHPFNDVGVQAVTELGLSPKDAGFAIGNKGVGFKSVFQVSDAPEIYSGSGPGVRFADSGFHFRFDGDPFRSEEFSRRLTLLVDKVLHTRPGLVDRIRERCAGSDPRVKIVEHARRSAPFRFPLPLTAGHLKERLTAINLPAQALHAPTLIVLPIRDGEKASAVVEKALDEVFDHGDAMLLFLPAVNKLVVLDHERSRYATFERTEQIERISTGNGRIAHTSHRSIHIDRSESSPETRSWIVISRTVGADDCHEDKDAALKERNAIHEAAQALRHDNWKSVDRALVSVALPLPASDDDVRANALHANGRFFIALPTLDHTGIPLSVDAPFHGTISRKGIDFDEPYNKLLFSEAVALTEDLAAVLRSDPSLGRRRLTVLAVHKTGPGPLAEVLRGPKGLARRDIVLGADLQSFLSPQKLSMPGPEDVGTFTSLAHVVGDVARFGFVLPDRLLLEQARDVLDALPARTSGSSADLSRYLDRPGGQHSFLEAAAHGLRAQGGSLVFESFLQWVCNRFKGDITALDDQRILPVGENDLAARRDRVFLHPSARAAQRLAGDVESGSAEVVGQSEEAPQADLPSDVRSALRFLDENVIRVRSGERDLTPLARALAPDTGGGLVRRPRIPEVLDEIVAPRIEEAARAGDNSLALRLLQVAIGWLAALPSKSRKEVHGDRLRVPVLDAAGGWHWLPPGEAVFGRGWLGGRDEELLVRIYERDERRLLVPWEDLARKLADAPGAPGPQREFWLEQLTGLGVWATPRILTEETTHAPFVARFYSELTSTGAACPFVGIDELWFQWLEAVRRRSVRVASRQTYDFDKIHWVEHLESPDCRADVVALILCHPEVYRSITHLSLQRTRPLGGDSRVVPSLWVFAIESQDWPVIPTVDHGLISPSRAFLLDREQALVHADRYSFLPHVEMRLESAAPLLSAMGVVRLADASAERLIGALHELAETFSGTGDRERSAHALAADLFSRLQRVCVQSPATDLATIASRPVPLERGRRLEALRLTDVECVYVADDPVRMRLLPPDRVRIPLLGSSTAAALVERLRAALGPARVVLASEAPIDSGFQEDPGASAAPLFDVLREDFPNADLESDIGCVLAYLGKQSQQPGGEAFLRSWRRLQATDIVRGRFAETFPQESLHVENGARYRLCVSNNLKRGRLVEAIWAAIGIGHRDVFAAYARALDEGAVERFFAERSVGPAERSEIDAAIGAGLGMWLQPIRALILAAWRLHHVNVAIDEFVDGWSTCAATMASFDAFVGIQGLGAWLHQYRHLETEEIVLRTMAKCGIDSEGIASAIADTGSDLVFEESRRSWEARRERLAATLMAVAARRARVDVDAVRNLIDWLRQQPFPLELAHRPRDDERTRRILLEATRTYVGTTLKASSPDAFTAVLEDQGLRRPHPLGFVAPADVSEREINEYEDRKQDTRKADAEEVISDLLAIALRLATHRNISLDAAALRADPRVSLLSKGFLANRYAMLVAVADVLDRTQPTIAGLLRDAGAFRAPTSRQELTQRLAAVLGPPTPPPAPVQPPPPIYVAGVELPATALKADLEQGSAGSIGQRLAQAAAASTSLDLSVLRSVARGKAVPPGPPGPIKEPRRSTRGTAHSESRIERERLGLVGEIFAFELLRRLLDDFDQANWCSENRNMYGFGAPGADAVGADFEWHDRQGRLTGRADAPRCLIEVKSSAGDTDGPFHLSINQWNVAQRCHQSGGREVYVILRIADVSRAPRLASILIDPVQMEKDGMLVLSQSEMWARTGEILAEE